MRDFWHMPLKELTPEEWEALCDRCGKCCRSILDSDTNTLTDTACRLHDPVSNECTNYRKRFSALKLDDGYRCQKITMRLLETRAMPDSCAYARRFRGEALEVWQVQKAIDHGNGG